MARAIGYVLALQRGVAVSVPWIKSEFGISQAQAKRDFLDLERLLPVERVRRQRVSLRLKSMFPVKQGSRREPVAERAAAR